MLQQLQQLPADPILGISAACRADPNPHKVDLAVGIYMNEEGVCPVFEAVRLAQRALVDEAAMIEALKSGHLRHAGLDVYMVEPLPTDHELKTIHNVTLSAHSAFRTPEAGENLIAAALEHCRRIAKEGR